MLKKLLAAVVVVTLLPLTATAAEIVFDTQVDQECDETTITNLADEAQTYHVQVYEGTGDITLQPGESYNFRTVTNRGTWAVWTNDQVVASGEFCNVYVPGGEKIPAEDYRPDPERIVDGTDAPTMPIEVSEVEAPVRKWQTFGLFQPI